MSVTFTLPTSPIYPSELSEISAKQKNSQYWQLAITGGDIVGFNRYITYTGTDGAYYLVRDNSDKSPPGVVVDPDGPHTSIVPANMDVVLPPVHEHSVICEHNGEGPHCHVKRAKLVLMSPDDYMPARTLYDEHNLLHMIRDNPHPNLARFHGCVASNGYIQGLCSERYKMTLRSAMDEKVALEIPAFTRQLWRAVFHLHDMGVIHNDLNPNNIMLNEHNEAIIIDFDSSDMEDELMKEKGGTPNWSDGWRVCSARNDYLAMYRIIRYLNGEYNPPEYRTCDPLEDDLFLPMPIRDKLSQ